MTIILQSFWIMMSKASKIWKQVLKTVATSAKVSSGLLINFLSFLTMCEETLSTHQVNSVVGGWGGGMIYCYWVNSDVENSQICVVRYWVNLIYCYRVNSDVENSQICVVRYWVNSMGVSKHVKLGNGGWGRRGGLLLSC